MTRKQSCTIQGCTKPSIPGLVRGHGKCQYHWNVGCFGQAWADECEARAEKQRTWIGKRVEIPVHYDLWMQGARFGRITAYRNGKDGQSDYFLVRIDRPQVKKLLKVWRHDWDFMKETR